MSKNKGKKEKKEKITYVDDGSTIVDMSATKNPTKSVKKETTQNKKILVIYEVFLLFTWFKNQSSTVLTGDELLSR